jgi:hypothetical protein
MNEIDRNEKLLEIAREYQKGDGQNPNVLVEQVLKQIDEEREEIAFSIPYNPSFIADGKQREDNGLDEATRQSLDNIAKFLEKINKTTGKKVIFNLVYDASLSLGSSDFIDKGDYLDGIFAIHRYIKRLNNDHIQIREYDILANIEQTRKYDIPRETHILIKPQSREFLDRTDLDEIFYEQLARLDFLFRNPEELESIYNFFRNLHKYHGNDLTPESEVTMNDTWLGNVKKKYQTRNSEKLIEKRKLATKITEADEIFKKLDEESRKNTSISRLSPHGKTDNDRSKFGFAFFPKAIGLFEPWVGKVLRPNARLLPEVRDFATGDQSAPIKEPEELGWKEGQIIYNELTRGAPRDTVTKRVKSIKKRLMEKVKEYKIKGVATGGVTNRAKRFEIFKDILEPSTAEQLQSSQHVGSKQNPLPFRQPLTTERAGRGRTSTEVKDQATLKSLPPEREGEKKVSPLVAATERPSTTKRTKTRDEEQQKQPKKLKPQFPQKDSKEVIERKKAIDFLLRLQKARADYEKTKIRSQQLP